MTIRLPESVLKKLAKLAHSTDRSKSYLAAKAIEEFVEAHEWQIQQIEEAVREAERPDATFHDHATVARRIKKLAKARVS